MFLELLLLLYLLISSVFLQSRTVTSYTFAGNFACLCHWSLPLFISTIEIYWHHWTCWWLVTGLCFRKLRYLPRFCETFRRWKRHQEKQDYCLINIFLNFILLINEVSRTVLSFFGFGYAACALVLHFRPSSSPEPQPNIIFAQAVLLSDIRRNLWRD